jgi:hypothetical protein
VVPPDSTSASSPRTALTSIGTAKHIVVTSKVKT